MTIVTSGEASSGLTVSSGQTLEVQSGGTVTATTIQSGGSATIDFGGYSSAAVINGGIEIVSGMDSGSTIENAGTMTIAAGGSASTTTVDSGNTEIVSSGGYATAAVDDRAADRGAGRHEEPGHVPQRPRILNIISGSGLGDFIDLTSLTFSAGAPGWALAGRLRSRCRARSDRSSPLWFRNRRNFPQESCGETGETVEAVSAGATGDRVSLYASETFSVFITQAANCLAHGISATSSGSGLGSTFLSIDSQSQSPTFASPFH